MGRFLYSSIRDLSGELIPQTSILDDHHKFLPQFSMPGGSKSTDDEGITAGRRSRERIAFLARKTGTAEPGGFATDNDTVTGLNRKSGDIRTQAGQVFEICVY